MQLVVFKRNSSYVVRLVPWLLEDYYHQMRDLLRKTKGKNSNERKTTKIFVVYLMVNNISLLIVEEQSMVHFRVGSKCKKKLSSLFSAIDPLSLDENAFVMSNSSRELLLVVQHLRQGQYPHSHFQSNDVSIDVSSFVSLQMKINQLYLFLTMLYVDIGMNGKELIGNKKK